jgi:DNA-directed RNA polymerase specialized sigma24 family protein
MSPEMKEEVLKLYFSGIQQKEIAAKFGKARSSINHFIKRELAKLESASEEALFTHLDYYRF